MEDVQILCSMLKKGSEREQIQAAKKLGQLGNSQAIPLLLQTLQNSNIPLKREAALALLQLEIFEGAVVVFFVITIMFTKAGEMEVVDDSEVVQ